MRSQMADARMRRLLLAVAAIAFVSGCGAPESDPNLAAAAAKTEDAGTSRFAATGTELHGNELVTCTGEADYGSTRVRLSCDYGSEQAWEIVAVGTDWFMRGGGFATATSSDKWVSITDDDESLANELSPQRLLAVLRGASRDTEQIGNEEVRGVETVRYRLVVDCEEVELVECEGLTNSVDVWVDDDGLVRRIAVDGTRTPFTFEFFDFGAKVEIEAPPAGEVVDFDEWYAPKPCRLGDGVPLTGRDVSAVLRSHGLNVVEESECHLDAVAVLSFEGSEEPHGFGSCSLLAEEHSVTFELRGMQSATVGNVHCSYSEGLASEMDAVVAELERKIRE